MTDVTFALEAKSDQLNAVDLMAENRTIKIRKVDVKKGDQPVSVFFDGDNNKPWKPSKGMLRILAGAWGKDSASWIGKYVEIYFSSDVVYAGKAVGGIRIISMSDINPQGFNSSLSISRQKRIPYNVSLLTVNAEPYPDDQFETGFPIMAEKMASGEMTLQSVIARCQITGALTPDQLKRLEKVAPDDAEDEEGHEYQPESNTPTTSSLDDDAPATAETPTKEPQEPEKEAEAPAATETEKPVDSATKEQKFIIRSPMGDEYKYATIEEWSAKAMAMIEKAGPDKKALNGFNKRHETILTEIEAVYPEQVQVVREAVNSGLNISVNEVSKNE